MIYRLQQILIFFIHILLLYWMYYVLAESGTMEISKVLYHFLGIGIYGALLIFGTAKWAKYHYLKDKSE